MKYVKDWKIIMKIKKFNNIYKKLYKKLLKSKTIGNTKELLNIKFTINPNDNILYIRKPSLKYILAETIWYFTGSESSKWIGQFASMWNNITDDGKTSNSAYGNILFKRHNYNQINQVIDNAKKEDFKILYGDTDSCFFILPKKDMTKVNHFVNNVK